MGTLARYIVMLILFSMMNEVYHQAFLNKLLNNLKLLKKKLKTAELNDLLSNETKKGD